MIAVDAGVGVGVGVVVLRLFNSLEVFKVTNPKCICFSKLCILDVSIVILNAFIWQQQQQSWVKFCRRSHAAVSGSYGSMK